MAAGLLNSNVLGCNEDISNFHLFYYFPALFNLLYTYFLSLLAALVLFFYFF